MSAQEPSESGNRLPYPPDFLMDMAEDMERVFREYCRAFGIPEVVSRAVETLVYLRVLIGYYDRPATFLPSGTEGYKLELDSTVKDLAWLIDDIISLRIEKIKSMTDKEYSAAIQKRSARSKSNE
jgi:hypothetical protein